MDQHRQVVRRLLRVAGTTYAAEADVGLADKPMPLFQLLVLCMLASKPIAATIAMRAGHELFRIGLTTPKAVLHADRQAMIDAFGRAHYARYDESSATRLTEMAERVTSEYSGDLREIPRRTSANIDATKQMLMQFKGIGDTGADIFFREVQDVWTWARPHFDKRATKTATSLGLPSDPDELGALAPRSNARLAAALVRASLDEDVRQQVLDRSDRG